MAKERQKKAFAFAANRLSPQTASGPDVYALQALLGRYGYLAGSYKPGTYDEASREAVMQFQSFYRLYPEEDGTCDEQTLKLLNQPRCGVPDVTPTQRTPTGRLAPFVTVGAKWPKTALRFQFLNATPDLIADRQRVIIRDAFAR